MKNVCKESCIMQNDKFIGKIFIFILENFNSNDKKKKKKLKYVNKFFFTTCLVIDPSGTNMNIQIY